MEQQKTILLTEDEDLNYELMEELLSDTNLLIIRAFDGAQAVEICKTNNDIVLVLMDLKMPVLDGFEATKQIKAIRPDLPVIAQTAFATSADKSRALECGCSEFLGKPFNYEQFIEIVNAYLKK